MRRSKHSPDSWVLIVNVWIPWAIHLLTLTIFIMILPNLRYFRDDLRMTTWLLVGAGIQACLLLFVPPRVAVVPTFLLLLSRTLAFVLRRHGLLEDSSLKGAHIGRYTTQIPRSDGTFSERHSDQEVTVIILAVQSNHVQGRFAPGFQELGDAFGDMWRDLSKDREHNGYLGKTSTLFATDHDSGNTMTWISYWRSAEHLHKWAQTPVHRKGMDMFAKYQKSNPHIAIMHELYSVPKHHWETIYINFKPFGFGRVKPVDVTEGEKGSGKKISPLISAEDPSWKTSKARMGLKNV